MIEIGKKCNCRRWKMLGEWTERERKRANGQRGKRAKEMGENTKEMFGGQGEIVFTMRHITRRHLRLKNIPTSISTNWFCGINMGNFGDYCPAVAISFWRPLWGKTLLRKASFEGRPLPWCWTFFVSTRQKALLVRLWWITRGIKLQSPTRALFNWIEFSYELHAFTQ